MCFWCVGILLAPLCGHHQCVYSVDGYRQAGNPVCVSAHVENYTTYYEVMSKNLAIASTMLASTPLLTLGLMTGSIYAFSGFAQKMSGQDYIQEKNLAPNNIDVAPVTKVATQGTRDAFLGQSTNATSLPEVGVGQALQQVKASRQEEMVTNQLSTLEKFDTMVSAQRQVGGSTKVTNSEGVNVAASHQAAFQEGMNQIRNVGRQGVRPSRCGDR